MKLKYQAVKKARINYGFLGFYSLNNEGFFELHHCKSVKAFRRKLKKVPKGYRVRLRSKWVGYDVYGLGNLK